MDLTKLNSLTKYPSIPTYHPIGDRGRLSEADAPQFAPDERVYVTEKIDGTNARIIFTGDDWFIGSRENLLLARGDRIGDPAQGIVAAIRSIAERVFAGGVRNMVVFGEVYGGKVSAASKEYASAGATGLRVFDVFALGAADLDVAGMDAAAVSAWREAGGQPFAPYETMRDFAAKIGLDVVPAIEASAPPADLRGAADWLAATMPRTLAPLDDKAGGRPEGVVVRNGDRSRIYKLRFEDYRRTLK